MTRVFTAIGRASVRWRWVIIAVWVLGTVVAARSLPTLASQVNNDNSQFLPASAPSNQAALLAQPLIGSDRHSYVPVVLQGPGRQFTAADRVQAARVKAALAKVPTVASVTFAAASDRRAAVQLLVSSTTTPFGPTGPKMLVNSLQAAIAGLHLPAGFQAHLAGQVAAEVANNEQSNHQGNVLQLASIIFIIVLLLFIFRAALAPFVTLLPPVLVLVLAGSFIGALGAHGLKISFFTQILLIVLLLGAGTDYGLFLVFRVREELLDGRPPHEAVAVSVRRVGESIAASAGTVVVALLSLTLASFGIYHDLGVPLAIGIVVMLAAGLTLLPALLAVLGRAVFWPSKTAPRAHEDGVWGRIAGRLVQRPGVTLAVGVVVLGALSLAALGYRAGGFGGSVAAPAGSSAAAGNAELARDFPQSNGNPTNLVVRFGTSAWQHPEVLQTVTDQLRRSGRFTTMTGPLDPNGVAITPAELATLHAALPPAASLVAANRLTPAGTDVPADLYQAYLATARYLSADGRTAQWEVGLAAGDPGSTPALQAVPAIRAELAAAGRAAGATATGVAGEAPALYDISNISGSDLRHIIPIAVLAIGIVLALVLRSLVAPLYLIASVVLSYLASLGIAVIVFIDIGGSGGIVFLLPFLMFIFLLALGEDYNILVMTRIREEAAKHPLRRAVVRAVGTTGPTVTSAGLVLAGSFVVLAVVGGSGAGNGQVREIGLGLAVGILLDTFVVRTVLVPSTVSLLGRWNWWPSAMARHTAPAAAPGTTPAAAPGTAAVSVAGDGDAPVRSDGTGSAARSRR